MTIDIAEINSRHMLPVLLWELEAMERLLERKEEAARNPDDVTARQHVD
jgi:hypothetical protein